MLEREKAELDRFSDPGGSDDNEDDGDDDEDDGDVGVDDNDDDGYDHDVDNDDDVAVQKSRWRMPFVGRMRRTGR